MRAYEKEYGITNMFNLANLITLTNLSCGMLGCIAAAQGHMNLVYIYLVGALAADWMDGMVARWLKSSSPLGAELDSLADVVSFGVLPGVAVYMMLAAQPFYWHDALSYVAIIVPVLSALRLARFNVSTHDSPDFIGLNTPSATIGIIGAVHWWTVSGWPTSLFILVIVLLSICMILPLPMLSLKPSPRDRSRTLHQAILIIVPLMIALWDIDSAALIGIVWYIVFSALQIIMAKPKELKT